MLAGYGGAQRAPAHAREPRFAAAPSTDHGPLAADAALRRHVPGLRRRAAGSDLCARFPPDHRRRGHRAQRRWRRKGPPSGSSTNQRPHPTIPLPRPDLTRPNRASCVRRIINSPAGRRVLAARGNPAAGQRTAPAGDLVGNRAGDHGGPFECAGLAGGRAGASATADDHRRDPTDLGYEPPRAARLGVLGTS